MYILKEFHVDMNLAYFTEYQILSDNEWSAN